jgi:hypothetical protein
VTAVNATLALGLEPWDNDDQPGALYCAIFKTDQWLIKITEELGANPFVIGANLQNFQFSGKPK